MAFLGFFFFFKSNLNCNFPESSAIGSNDAVILTEIIKLQVLYMFVHIILINLNTNQSINTMGKLLCHWEKIVENEFY